MEFLSVQGINKCPAWHQHHLSNMAIPKTPKNSTTAAKVPKTPKGVGRANAKDGTEKRAGAKEKKRKLSVADLEAHKKNKTSKSKSSTNAPSEKKQKSKQATDKPKAPKKVEPAVQRTSVVDRVLESSGSAGFFGQETKAKKMNSLQLKMAQKYASDGVFHYQSAKAEDVEPLTEVHLAYIQATNPISKMKFAKSGTRYCQLENEAFYAAKCRQLKTLQQLSGKQTLGMATIHCDRTYLSGLDFDMNKLAKVSTTQAREHLVEDFMAVCAGTKDKTQLRPLAYKECDNIDKQWPVDEATDLTLGQLGQQMYGSQEPWPVL